MTVEAGNLGAKEIQTLAEEAKFIEYGIRGGEIAPYWREKQGCVTLSVGLDNCDTDQVLLSLLKDEADSVLAGCALAACALGASNIRLHIPEGQSALKQALEPKLEENMRLVEGIVDVRSDRTMAFHHIETMYHLASLAKGEAVTGRYITVLNNGDTVAPRMVPFGTPLSAVVNTDFKGLRVGTRLYGGEGAELLLEPDLAVCGGVVEVLGQKECLVVYSERQVGRMRRQCCGKCTFCREGLGQFHAVMKELEKGKGDKALFALMEEIADAMPHGTLCSVGQQGGLLVRQGMLLFHEEFEAHLRKNCPAGVCMSDEAVYIDPRLCTGCGDCQEVCPVDAVEGRPRYIHMIDKATCTLCGKCIEACPEDAVVKTSGKVPKLPTRPVKCGKFRG